MPGKSNGAKIKERLSTLGDLMLLNLLFFLAACPVVTLGAAASALCYGCQCVFLEEGHPASSFWKAFKRDWKQATLLWILLLPVFFLIAVDFVLALYGQFPCAELLLIPGVLLLLVSIMVSVNAFPLLARFENTLLQTIKNALFIGLKRPLQSLLWFTLGVLPILLLILMPTLFLRGGFLWIGVWYALLGFGKVCQLRTTLGLHGFDTRGS